MDIYIQEKSIFDYKHKEQKRINPYYGYIYFSFNLVNGKKYIGQSGKKFTGKYLGSGNRIRKAIKKYGKKNFIVHVIEWCDFGDCEKTSKKLLDQKEEFWLKFFNAKYDDKFYNVIDTATPALRGKENGFYGKTHSTETLEKIKISTDNRTEEQKQDSLRRQKESLDLFYESEEGKLFRKRMGDSKRGKNLTQEHNQKIRNSLSDRTEEQKQESSKKLSDSLLQFYSSEQGVICRKNMSIQRTGRKMPEGFGENASKRLKGVPKTPEHINKINRNPEKIRKTAEKHRGMKRSEQAKENMSKAKKGNPAPNKGTFHYHDPINRINKQFSNIEDVPKGWKRGSGKIVFHDPETLVNYTCFEGEQQNNWIKGRCKKK